MRSAGTSCSTCGTTSTVSAPPRFGREGRAASTPSWTSMLRRFEIYSIRSDADEDAVAELERACREFGRYIPEVLDSAVGRNLSEAPVQLVWEHAFRSPEAYQRYMVHPYHAAILDRYLLPDSPQRVVTTDRLG